MCTAFALHYCANLTESLFAPNSQNTLHKITNISSHDIVILCLSSVSTKLTTHQSPVPFVIFYIILNVYITVNSRCSRLFAAELGRLIENTASVPLLRSLNTINCTALRILCLTLR